MMKPFKIDFSWEDPQGVKGSELRATWASLKMFVNDEVISRHENKYTRAIAEDLVEPLYPLAEWLALNWWALSSEVENPRANRQRQYARRHNLLFAGDGYPWPSLEISPADTRTILAWKSMNRPECRLRFLETGSATVESVRLREAFEDIIGAVVGRLNSEGVRDTLLQQEWKAIQECDDEESTFCLAAARLGLDPYDISKKQAAAITAAETLLDKSITGEFFAAADAAHLDEQAHWLRGEFQLLRKRPSALTSISELPKRVKKPAKQETPWADGYELAKAVRCGLDLNGDLLGSMGALADAWDTSEAKLKKAILPLNQGNFADALLQVNDNNRLVFAVAEKARETSKRFALCRCLGEYLSSNGTSALITATHSERQQCNRAFASEFLAPEELLKPRIKSSYVDSNQIEELAEEFGVSGLVIAHQIRNHKLATLPYMPFA